MRLKIESQAWPRVCGLRFGVYGFERGIVAQRSAGQSTRSPKLEQEAVGAFRGGLSYLGVPPNLPYSG